MIANQEQLIAEIAREVIARLEARRDRCPPRRRPAARTACSPRWTRR